MFQTNVSQLNLVGTSSITVSGGGGTTPTPQLTMNAVNANYNAQLVSQMQAYASNSLYSQVQLSTSTDTLILQRTSPQGLISATFGAIGSTSTGNRLLVTAPEVAISSSAVIQLQMGGNVYMNVTPGSITLGGASVTSMSLTSTATTLTGPSTLWFMSHQPLIYQFV